MKRLLFAWFERFIKTYDVEGGDLHHVEPCIFLLRINKNTDQSCQQRHTPNP